MPQRGMSCTERFSSAGHHCDSDSKSDQTFNGLDDTERVLTPKREASGVGDGIVVNWFEDNTTVSRLHAGVFLTSQRRVMVFTYLGSTVDNDEAT